MEDTLIPYARLRIDISINTCEDDVPDLFREVHQSCFRALVLVHMPNKLFVVETISVLCSVLTWYREEKPKTVHDRVCR